uniref:Uncharacterized protein n=1 Tax=Anguilla anguilla TaxID=7936 RepID=A0A0E9VPM4_ANGAN
MCLSVCLRQDYEPQRLCKVTLPIHCPKGLPPRSQCRGTTPINILLPWKCWTGTGPF